MWLILEGHDNTAYGHVYTCRSICFESQIIAYISLENEEMVAVVIRAPDYTLTS